MILFISEKALQASFDFILESIMLIRKWFEEIHQPDDYKSSAGLAEPLYCCELERDNEAEGNYIGTIMSN